MRKLGIGVSATAQKGACHGDGGILLAQCVLIVDERNDDGGRLCSLFSSSSFSSYSSSSEPLPLITHYVVAGRSAKIQTKTHLA